ncbi:hypothetical protein SEVIR_8G158400v4 [Setaria viridis]
MHAAAAAEEERAAELAGPLRDILPPVDFCCAYGSTLLHARPDGTSMVDYILGVADPLHWHSENLKRNPAHYSRWMGRLGAGAITGLADRIGVGVYFNPFVEWRDKRIKYGVVRMKDLAMDVLTWDRFYLSGRLQKPVHVLVDNWDIRKVNTINLEMATSASLLLLPEEFNEVFSTLMLSTIIFLLSCVYSNLCYFKPSLCSMTYMLKFVVYHIWVI